MITWPWQQAVYHVEYIQDCGWAVMECVVKVFGSRIEIGKRFPAIAREQNPGLSIQEAFEHMKPVLHRAGSHPKTCPICEEMTKYEET
jgi:hypothetical protein